MVIVLLICSIRERRLTCRYGLVSGDRGQQLPYHVGGLVACGPYRLFYKSFTKTARKYADEHVVAKRVSFARVGGSGVIVSRTLRASRPPTNAADPSTRVYPFQPARSMSSVPAFDGLAQLKVCSRTKASRLAAPLVPSHCVPRCLYSLTPVSSADAVSPVTRTLLPDNLPISGQLHARSCARRE